MNQDTDGAELYHGALIQVEDGWGGPVTVVMIMKTKALYMFRDRESARKFVREERYLV